MTPEEYVKACEEAYEICAFLPPPETLEQFLLLDKLHPPTKYNAGWADGVSAPADWHAKRPPEPKRFTQNWRLAWDGTNFIVRDEEGAIVARSPDKRNAVQLSLLQAARVGQSVMVLDSQ